MIKKIYLSLAVVLSFFFYVAYERGIFNGNDNRHTVTPPSTLQTSQTYTPPTTTPTPTSAPAPTSTPKSVPTPTPVPVPVPKPVGQYKDGSYTGSVADAYYGNVQVQAIISGGKITNVKFLQYPSDRQTSQMINSQAMPWLTQEAIQAQSANVNIISGATATSGAFQESLAVALIQAKN